MTLWETFKCSSNEHNRRGSEEILSQEKIWIASRLRVIHWRMKVKQASGKLLTAWDLFFLCTEWGPEKTVVCDYVIEDIFFFNYLRTKAKQRLTLAFPNFSVLDFAILIMSACSWEWFLMLVHICRERERESLLSLVFSFNTYREPFFLNKIYTHFSCFIQSCLLT